MVFPTPNIGVTGFMWPYEIAFAQEVFNRLFDEYNLADKKAVVRPRLMAGALVSSKTIDGRPNKYPGRYPRLGILNDLCCEANNYKLQSSLRSCAS